MEDYVRRPNCSCLICGKEVYRRPKQLESGKIYCSNTCFGKACQHPIICPVCGTEFLNGNKRSKHCSRACSNKSRAGLDYKGRRPKKDIVVAQRAIRTRVLDKTKVCCKCGFDKTHLLHVHHIVERCKGGSNDLSNLELICPNCHAEEHYNRKNGTLAEPGKAAVC